MGYGSLPVTERSAQANGSGSEHTALLGCVGAVS